MIVNYNDKELIMSKIIIDTHAHIFPSKIATKAVLNIGAFYGIPMQGDGSLTTLIANGEASGVTHFIVNSSATTCGQVTSINDFIIDSISGLDNVYGLCTMHPDMTESEVDVVIEKALANNLIGVKLHPDFQMFNIDDERAYKIYRKCEGILPILFHTGDPRYDYSRPIKLIKVAKEFPNLKCIAAHFGGYSRWDEVAGYVDTPNVYFDTSSSLFILPINEAKALIKLLGVERFMFGVDFPMWEHGAEMDNINKLDLTDTETDMVMSENAIRFYGLNI